MEVRLEAQSWSSTPDRNSKTWWLSKSWQYPKKSSKLLLYLVVEKSIELGYADFRKPPHRLCQPFVDTLKRNRKNGKLTWG